jgi:hypothetical protein
MASCSKPTALVPKAGGAVNWVLAIRSRPVAFRFDPLQVPFCTGAITTATTWIVSTTGKSVAAIAYAKIEATYSIPLVAEVGGGARFSGDKVRPYGTVAVPLAPKISLKGNAGPKYYALGLKAGF